MLKWNTELKTMNVVTAILGALLFISPWVLGFTSSQPATWSAWGLGVVSAVIALFGVAKEHEWEHWADGAIGILMIISPWVLRFSDLTNATWTHVVIGLITAILAAAEIWMVRDAAGGRATA